MSDRYPGGIITKTPVTPAGPYQDGTAPGIWTLEQQAYWKAQGLWPIAGNIDPGDPYYKYVTMLLTGDGTNGAQNNTFLDSSTNAFTITRNGNTTQGSFSPYGSLWSNYFDGTGDYLTLDSAVRSGSDFTIEAFIYPTSVSVSYQDICSGNVGPSPGGDFQFILNNATLYVWNGLSHQTAVTANTWHHVAVVRSGSTVKLYLDGVQSSSSLTNTGDFRVTKIGSNQANAETWNGYISNFRFVRSALYSADFTPPTTPLTVISDTLLLTCQSNSFIDNSSNANILTPSGNTSVQRFSPFNPTVPYSTATIGGSGYFDGTGDYLTAPATGSAFDIATGDFTIESWVYMNSTVNGTVSSLNKGSGVDGIYFVHGGGIYVTSNSSSWDIISLGTIPGITANAWNHVALVRNGNSWVVYLNGVNVHSVTSSASVSFTGTRLLGVGATGNGGVLLTGYISNFRIVKGTAVYTSNFTPPTAPLTAVTNTSLLLSCANAGIPDSAMMNDLETVGNAQINTTTKKYGTGSIYLDGTGDALRGVPNNVNLRFGTGDFTVEGWFYQTSDKTYPSALEIGDHITNGILFITKTSGNACVYAGGFYGGAATTLNQWNHIAWVRQSGSLKIFVNGVLGSTTAFTNNLSDVSVTTVGSEQTINANYAFPGYIDDLRVTNGYARYTANFTPPTSAFYTY